MTLAGLSNSSTKSKSHLETHELLDRFELLYDDIDELKDFRRAVLDQDLSSIFRLIGTNTKTRHLFNELRKAVLEKNIHAIFRVIQAIDDSENIDLIRNSVINKGDDIEVLRKTLSLIVILDITLTSLSFLNNIETIESSNEYLFVISLNIYLLF